jgi:threonine/homoserine/homoserine lactone efflux protein
VLLVACAGGLGLIFATVPALQLALKIIGALYMLWLAWKVANASPTGDNDDDLAQPLTFLQAAAFQWVNPKAVVIGLTAISIYVRPDRQVTDFLIVLAMFVLFTILTIVTWTGFGVALRSVLRDPRRARIFNVVMALLLVASIVPMVWPA